MKTTLIHITVFVFLCSQSCLAQHITKKSPCTKTYRHLVFEEGDKYLCNKAPIVDSFQYFYRPDFQCRYLDEDYLLCNIIQINDTINVDELPFSIGYVKKDDVKILDINVQVLESYKSKDNPCINFFFDEQLFKEEYLNKTNYGLFDYVAYIDSCVQDTTNCVRQLFLLVKNDEIPIIYSLQREKKSVLCNINRIIEEQAFYSDIIYFQSDYNTKDFYSLLEWSSFLHDRINEIISSCKKESQ